MRHGRGSVVDGVWIERRELPRKDGREHHQGQHHGARDRELVAAKARPKGYFGKGKLFLGNQRDGHQSYFTRGSSHAYTTSARRLENTTRNATNSRYPMSSARSLCVSALMKSRPIP